MRTMYDSIAVEALPAGADLYAGYDDGHWPDADAIAAAHPGVPVVRVTVDPGDDEGQVLDVENGDATPGQAPPWVIRRRAAGVEPTVYCSASALPGVRQAFTNAALAEPHWWVADWTENEAATAALLAQPGVVAVQYHSGPGYDVSAVADYWPGVDPAPVPDTRGDDYPQAVGAARTADGKGVWVVGADGGVFAKGAPFYGSLPELKVKPAAPIVAIVRSHGGAGYFLVGQDGGVFAFGDALEVGSYPGLPAAGRQGNREFGAGSLVLNSTGYTLLALDGDQYTFPTA